MFKDTLANILLDAGQVAPSQALYQEILEGRHGVMGAGHTKTLETLDKLLASYTEQGQLQAARRTLEARLAQIPGEDVEARAAYQERLESLNETGS